LFSVSLALVEPLVIENPQPIEQNRLRRGVVATDNRVSDLIVYKLYPLSQYGETGVHTKVAVTLVEPTYPITCAPPARIAASYLSEAIDEDLKMPPPSNAI
jgi:hypothetical protein